RPPDSSLSRAILLSKGGSSRGGRRRRSWEGRWCGELRIRSLFSAVLFLTTIPLMSADEGAKRRIALRVAEAWLQLPEMERMKGWGRRSGIELDVASESTPVPRGWETVFLGTLPASSFLRKRLERFPVRLEEKGFLFDGREYRGPEDAIALT